MSTKKLWLLREVENLPTNDNPFLPWYDTCDEMVVCAKDEDTARRIAQENGGDEARRCDDIWLNSKYTTCTPLKPDNEGVIIKSFLSA